jgi:hypothetical protein
MGHPKAGGRQKGTVNKSTQNLMDIADRIGVSPFEVLCMIAKADWQGLGYDNPTYLKAAGENMIEVDRITLESRLNAAKEASKYLYPQRKAVEHSTDSDKGFKIVIEDYKTKE